MKGSGHFLPVLDPLIMNVTKEQSATLAKLMDNSSLATVSDPVLGSNSNLLA